MASKKDWLLLAGRLIIGGIFIGTGWLKIAEMPKTVEFFSENFGLPFFWLIW